MTNVSSFKGIVTISSGLLLAACSVAPIYQKPAVPIPAAFKEAIPASEAGSWKTTEPSDALARGEWWVIFNDPRLNALQDQALEASQSLRALRGSGADACERQRLLGRQSQVSRGRQWRVRGWR